MAVLKLHLDEFDEVDYDLIAIHSSLEDYRLAYFLNQKLSVTLGRSKKDIEVRVPEGETMFPCFHYSDDRNAIMWSLVPNKTEIFTPRKANARSLFDGMSDEVATKVYLLPELKKVDYFLKIENNYDTVPVPDVVRNIQSIKRISTVYPVVPETIKSKNNLIF